MAPESPKIDSSTIEKRPVLDEVSIVIPTVGRDILRSSLMRIAQGSRWPARLVVVDQGGRDEIRGWLAALEEAGLESLYIPSVGRGRAQGLNEGLGRVDTPFFGITDDDCLVDESWLEVMVGVLVGRAQTVVSGKVLAGGESVVLTVTSEERAEYLRPRLSFDRLSGGNMGTSVEVLRKVGPFDESDYIRTAEDGEWAYRALRSGVTLIYEPALIVTHMDWRDADSRVRQYRSYARSHGGFYGKYLRRGDAFMGLRAAYHFARAAKTTLRGILSGNRDLRAMGWSYLSGLPAGIREGLRNEKSAP